jgi:hypothetical protein
MRVVVGPSSISGMCEKCAVFRAGNHWKALAHLCGLPAFLLETKDADLTRETEPTRNRAEQKKQSYLRHDCEGLRPPAKAWDKKQKAWGKGMYEARRELEPGRPSGAATAPVQEKKQPTVLSTSGSLPITRPPRPPNRLRHPSVHPASFMMG